MTTEYWETFLKRVTYKDVKFRVYYGNQPNDLLILVLSREVFDAENPEVRIPLVFRTDFPKTITDEGFMHLCYSSVQDFEMHEMQEWFKIDGKHFKDPHPERHL